MANNHHDTYFTWSLRLMEGKYINAKLGVGEIAPSVNMLSGEHEDLGQIPSTHIKSQA